MTTSPASTPVQTATTAPPATTPASGTTTAQILAQLSDAPPRHWWQRPAVWSATALLVLGVERGSQLAKAQGLSAIFVLREGDELREITVGL